MLNLKQTRFVNSQHYPVVAGVEIEDEGIALSGVMVDGALHVQPSSDTGGEVFVGVSFSRNVTPQFIASVVEEVVGTDLSVALGRAAIAGQISGKLVNPSTGVATPVTFQAGAPAAATEVQINATTGVCTFYAGSAGMLFKAVFKYTPTANEAAYAKGNATYGQLASTKLGVVGVLTNSPELSTSYFDASVDWSAGGVVKLGDGGMFTLGGTGTAVPNCIVSGAPGVDSPFLTLKFGQ
jgi:hypothetical protein